MRMLLMQQPAELSRPLMLPSSEVLTQQLPILMHGTLRTNYYQAYLIL